MGIGIAKGVGLKQLAYSVSAVQRHSVDAMTCRVAASGSRPATVANLLPPVRRVAGLATHVTQEIRKTHGERDRHDHRQAAETRH